MRSRLLCTESWPQSATTTRIRSCARRCETHAYSSLQSTSRSMTSCRKALMRSWRQHFFDDASSHLGYTLGSTHRMPCLIQRRFTASTAAASLDSTKKEVNSEASGSGTSKQDTRPENARNTMGDAIPNEEVFFNSSDINENEAYVKNHIDQYISITEVSTLDGVRWLDVEGRPERWKSGSFSREGSFAIAVIKALERINVSPDVLQLVARRVTLPELHVNEDSMHALLVLRTAKLNRKWPRISMRVRDEEYNVASLLSEIKTTEYVRRKRRLRQKLKEKKMEAERREAAERLLSSIKAALHGTGAPIHPDGSETEESNKPKDKSAAATSSTTTTSSATTSSSDDNAKKSSGDMDGDETTSAQGDAADKKAPPVRGIMHDPETCPVCLSQRKTVAPKVQTALTEKEFRAGKRLEERQGKAERLLAEEERQRLRKLAARYAIRNAHRERHSHLFGGPLAAIRRMSEGAGGEADVIPEDGEIEEDLDDEDIVADESDPMKQVPQTLDNITERLNIFVVREKDERFDALDDVDDGDDYGGETGTGGVVKEVSNIDSILFPKNVNGSDPMQKSTPEPGLGDTAPSRESNEDVGKAIPSESGKVDDTHKEIGGEGSGGSVETSQKVMPSSSSSIWRNMAVMEVAATTQYPVTYSSLTAFHSPESPIPEDGAGKRSTAPSSSEHNPNSQRIEGDGNEPTSVSSTTQPHNEPIQAGKVRVKPESAKQRKLRLLKHKIINAVESQYGKEAAQMFKGPSKAAQLKKKKKKQKLRAAAAKKKVFECTEETVEETPSEPSTPGESTGEHTTPVTPANGTENPSSPSSGCVAKPKRWRWCIITVHRSHMPFLDDMLFTWNHSQSVYKQSGSRLLFYQVHGAVQSIQRANTEHLRRLDELEMVLFQLPAQDRGFTNVLAQVHSISRCANVHAKQLRALQRCMENLHEHVSLDLSKSERFLEEQYIRSAISLSDELSEQARSLLFLQFSVGVNTMENHLRTLTVFSAVFVPIDFLSSWFGTNFVGIHDFCEMPNTIFACVGLMIATVMITMRWMRRNISTPGRA